jgi:hypothetical protein
MNQPSTKIAQFLILFVIGVIAVKSAIHADFFAPKNYKGKGYAVKIPEGWKIMKEPKGVVYPQGVGVVKFVPKGAAKQTERPDVYISIYTRKLKTPIWIEDEFPDILQSVKKAGFQVMDKGEIKLDGKIAKWLVYHDKRTPALVLEFYLDTDSNLFYKIQYFAHPDKFNKYRLAFEELKDSFKYRFSLY